MDGKAPDEFRTLLLKADFQAETAAWIGDRAGEKRTAQALRPCWSEAELSPSCLRHRTKRNARLAIRKGE